MKALGFDCGTYNLVMASPGKEEGKPSIKREINVFLKIENPQKFTLGMLRKQGVPMMEEDGSVYILGQAAIDLAVDLGTTYRRPMKAGCLSPEEKDAFKILGYMLKGMVGSLKEETVLFYSVPAEPIDAQGDTKYHEKVIGSILGTIDNLTAKPLNEASAIIYACTNNQTGIGISCVTPDTSIITDKGIIEIAKLHEGDRVLTRLGTYEQVSKVTVSERDEEIQEINFFCSNRNLRITSEHKIYTKSNGIEQWKRSDQVTNEDYVMMPSVSYKDKTCYIAIDKRVTCSKDTKREFYEVHENVAKFIGLFLGDGHIELSKGGIFFDFGKHETNLHQFVMDIAKEKFGNSMSFIEKGEECIRCQMNNKALARWLKENCYDSSGKKKLPWLVDELNRPARIGLLSGLLESDGHIGDNEVSFENTSSALTMLVQQLCLSEGYTGSYWFRDSRSGGTIENRTITGNDSCCFTLHEQYIQSLKFLISGNRHRTTSFQDSKQWNKVRSNQKVKYTGKVYDLTVENEHSFCVPGCCIHNCGAGMINVAFVKMGVNIFEFSLTSSGDWIDRESARVTGESEAFINQAKHNIDLSKEPQNMTEMAISKNYEILIERSILKIKDGIINSKGKAKTQNPIPIVIAGGTSSVNGFMAVFKKTLERIEMPIPISECIQPLKPLHSVAKGCLVAAELEAG